MKIVVIGGRGLIGTKLVRILRERGHEVVAASPRTGVNTLTGEGLATAMAGAQVVVDVANSPSFEAAASRSFFETSARHVFSAETSAAIRHHVALSVVGLERLPDVGYMRAKLVQEAAIKSSKIPYSIVRATQFYEFIGSIVEGGVAEDGNVRLTSALFQPIAANVCRRTCQAMRRSPARLHARQSGHLAEEPPASKDPPASVPLAAPEEAWAP